MADDDEGGEREFFPGTPMGLPPVGSPPGEYVEGVRVREPVGGVRQTTVGAESDDSNIRWPDFGEGPARGDESVQAVINMPLEALLGVAGAQETLGEWWHRVAQEDLDMLGPKVNEYGGSGGSYDLDLVGRILADTTGRHDASRAVREELGCFHYLVGKLGRMAAAYREGKLPSDDTLTDSVVYLMMVRRIRAVGGWPWSSEDPADA